MCLQPCNVKQNKYACRIYIFIFIYAKLFLHVLSMNISTYIVLHSLCALKWVSGCCWQNNNAPQWFWSAIFVVGCEDWENCGRMGGCTFIVFDSVVGSSVLHNYVCMVFFLKDTHAQTHCLNEPTPRIKTYATYLLLFWFLRKDIRGILQGDSTTLQTCPERLLKSLFGFGPSTPGRRAKNQNVSFRCKATPQVSTWLAWMQGHACIPKAVEGNMKLC